MKRLLYIFGLPGVGKTRTLADSLPDTYHYETEPIPHIVYPGGAQIGKSRGVFSGTDALSYSVQPRVVEWLAACPFSALVAEGDRLANDKFFNAVQAADWQLDLVMMSCAPSMVAQRRGARVLNPSEHWVRTRNTKVERLFEAWQPTVIRTDDTAAAVRELRAHPVIRQLHG